MGAKASKQAKGKKETMKTPSPKEDEKQHFFTPPEIPPKLEELFLAPTDDKKVKKKVAFSPSVQSTAAVAVATVDIPLTPAEKLKQRELDLEERRMQMEMANERERLELERKRVTYEKQRVDNETKLVDSHGKVVDIASSQQGTIDKTTNMLGYYVEKEKTLLKKSTSNDNGAATILFR